MCRRRLPELGRFEKEQFPTRSNRGGVAIETRDCSPVRAMDPLTPQTVAAGGCELPLSAAGEDPAYAGGICTAEGGVR